jgi:2-polyprenyl-3-methyl-5-hydroxy-6-metoxy-1,4-benzoquinol methylase
MPEFEDRAFDVVVSNSVLEHFETVEEQQRMAAEIRRLGRRYLVQTPNRRFPIEPHFLFPFFQYLPMSARVFLLTHFRMGWTPRVADPERARAIAREVRLLARHEIESLFPGSTIHVERFLGLPKSFVACGRAPDAETSPGVGSSATDSNG